MFLKYHVVCVKKITKITKVDFLKLLLTFQKYMKIYLQDILIEKSTLLDLYKHEF